MLRTAEGARGVERHLGVQNLVAVPIKDDTLVIQYTVVVGFEGRVVLGTNKNQFHFSSPGILFLFRVWGAFIMSENSRKG